MDWIEKVFEYFILPVFVIFLVIFLVAIPFMIYSYCTADHKYISLESKDWECTKTKSVTIMMPMAVGKTTVMMPQIQTHCVQYELK